MSDFINKYADPERVRDAIEIRKHRGFIGGMWEEIGGHQFRFLKQNGLAPHHRILDVGCGCLRVGVHLIEYLDAGNYFGIDLSEELIEVGYEVELEALGLQHKLPREHLRSGNDFDVASFGASFDVAFALSVFTHLPMNHMKLALVRLAGVMQEGGVFFATVFLTPDNHPWGEPLLQTALNRHTYPHKDPFHYTADDIRYCATGGVWACDIIGDWGHPRGQSMVKFTKPRH